MSVLDHRLKESQQHAGILRTVAAELLENGERFVWLRQVNEHVGFMEAGIEMLRLDAQRSIVILQGNEVVETSFISPATAEIGFNVGRLGLQKLIQGTLQRATK